MMTPKEKRARRLITERKYRAKFHERVKKARREGARRTRATHDKWVAKNRDKVRAASRRSHEKNRAKRNAYCRARWKRLSAEHKQKLAERRRLLNPNYAKEYWARNPGKRTAIKARYLAAIIRAVPVWFGRNEVDELYQARKAAEEILEITVHVDHIVPLQSKLVCGLHCAANLRLMPGRENQAKGNRHWPDMWPIEPANVRPVITPRTVGQ
jgi:hypothetical protein